MMEVTLPFGFVRHYHHVHTMTVATISPTWHIVLLSWDHEKLIWWTCGGHLDNHDGPSVWYDFAICGCAMFLYSSNEIRNNNFLHIEIFTFCICKLIDLKIKIIIIFMIKQVYKLNATYYRKYVEKILTSKCNIIIRSYYFY